jgi:hypothetical protein
LGGIDIHDNSFYSFRGRILAFTFGQQLSLSFLATEQDGQQVLIDKFGLQTKKE